MKELQYPFDSTFLIRKRKRLKRQLENQEGDFLKKKIAILGGSTTDSVVEMLDLFLLNQWIKADFYQSEFGRFYEDAVFGNDVMTAFSPDIVYIHTTSRNIMKFPALKDSGDTVSRMVDEEVEKFVTMWNSVREKYNCPIIQNNFEMPGYRIMGNKDASDIHGRTNFISRLNMKFYEYAQTHSDFYICDINYISADYGLKEWSDVFYWNMYKYSLNVNAIPYLAHNVANMIKSVFGLNKKGIVLDLDNTLWGGIIADDGVESISLGTESPDGQVYTEFQNYIMELKQLGVILAIDSKNDEGIALEGLRHPSSILHKEDFAAIYANWMSKDKNLRSICEELNILPDSLIFIDDNPAERKIVEGQLPGVCAPDIGAPTDYIERIDRNGFFELTAYSEDDSKRLEMYQKNTERHRLKAKYEDYNDYLKSLQMKAIIKPFDSMSILRITQLANKSNQFNLTTRRFTQTEITEMMDNPRYVTLYGRLEDIFGDNGIVSVAIGEMKENVCEIILWLMSCRVLKRNMEFAMMDVFEQACRKRNIDKIKGYFIPTKKNGMVRNFYGEMGFEMIGDNQGETIWILSLENNMELRNKTIKIEEYII